MTATTTEKRDYTIQIAWGDFRDDHNYGRSDVYPWSGARGKHHNTLTDAVAAAESHYGAGSGNSAVAFWIHETVTTVTVEKLTGGKTVTTTVVEEQKDAHTYYRSFDSWMEEIEKPYRQREAERVDSGEAALNDAYWAEVDENRNRREAGIPQVYTAAKAWAEFKGYPVAQYVPQEEESLQAKGFAKVLGFLSR